MDIAVDLDSAPPPPAPSRRPRGPVAIAAGVLLALVASAAVLSRDGAPPRPEPVRFAAGLRADLVPAVIDPTDPGRVSLTVGLANTGGHPLRLDRLVVQGLGSVSTDLPPWITIPPGERRGVRISVLPDCGTPARPPLRVLAGVAGSGLEAVRIEPVAVEPGSADGPAQTADRVLRPACPRAGDEIAVSVVAGIADPADPRRLRVRIVNHGRWPAVVEAGRSGPVRLSAPELPIRLPPGAGAVISARVAVLGWPPLGTGPQTALDVVSAGSWRQVTLQVRIRQPLTWLADGFWTPAVAAATASRCAAGRPEGAPAASDAA